MKRNELSNVESAINFRESLSTIVETCLEKYKHKSIWNFRNNINQAIDHAKNISHILEEAMYLVKQAPNEIDEIVADMNVWYTGVHVESKEKYDPILVSIFTEEITAMYVTILGNSFAMAKRLEAYERENTSKEKEAYNGK